MGTTGSNSPEERLEHVADRLESVADGMESVIEDQNASPPSSTSIQDGNGAEGPADSGAGMGGADDEADWAGVVVVDSDPRDDLYDPNPPT